MSPLQKVIDILGSASALARKLHVSPQAAQKMVSDEKIPPGRVLEVEAAVEGAIPCWELDPKMYPPERFAGCPYVAPEKAA